MKRKRSFPVNLKKWHKKPKKNQKYIGNSAGNTKYHNFQ